ncbi:MAG: P-loop containing nucleoside triphosphate hydrolase protein [Monoraphidium minutum]|nr:MAG: P-loop containing nucleoside triphosphate hydrolase protein [Monoraphidium minutum]
MDGFLGKAVAAAMSSGSGSASGGSGSGAGPAKPGLVEKLVNKAVDKAMQNPELVKKFATQAVVSAMAAPGAKEGAGGSSVASKLMNKFMKPHDSWYKPISICVPPTGARQDIQAARNRAAIVRPGLLQAKPEDEYELSYVYGLDASNADVHARSVAPLLRKLVEGYNVTVVLFGATGSGKTTALEGSRGRDARGGPEGDGLVHLAADELFELIHGKAVLVGEAVAKKRRMPSAKGFDYFVEASYVELYDEACRDLLAKGPGASAALPVVEDVDEGPVVAGLRTRTAKSADELRAVFNLGRANRDTQARAGSALAGLRTRCPIAGRCPSELYAVTMMDLGSVHERAAALFSVWLAQYAPAAAHGEEDRVTVSRLTFVDMPGAERLGMDTEVLRLREGLQINRSLVAFASVLRRLAEEGSSEFANYDESVLTRLTADALGGNALTLVVGTLRQGEWEASATTLRHLAVARRVRNYPIINHGRARGLLHKIRFRLLGFVEDRETLRDQLGAAPAEGDPADFALSAARVRDMEARLLEEREEKAALAAEKGALQARLAKLKDAGTGELREKAELQEALIRSEEQRLAVSRALIDFQMEVNEGKQAWEGERFSLEQRILELEAGRMEHWVKAEDAAALADARDELNRRLRDVQDDLQRARKAKAAADGMLEEAQQEVRRLNQLLATLEAAGAGDTAALLRPANDDEEALAVRAVAAGGAVAPAAAAGAARPKVNLGEIRTQLQRQVGAGAGPPGV